MQVLEHNGYAYTLTRMYSDCYCGQMSVYWVRTDNPNANVREIVRELLGYKNALVKDAWELLNTLQPNMYNHLLPYYECMFVPDAWNGHYEIIVRKHTDD